MIHFLKIKEIPNSIKNLKTGSEIWAGDEVRGFYFEIASEDFQKLLTGRNFEVRDFGATYIASTTHINPPVTMTARWHYVSDTNGSGCEIDVTEAKNCVIARFYAH